MKPKYEKDYKSSHAKPSPYGKRERFNVSVSSDEYVAIRGLSAKRKQTMSELARGLILRELSKSSG